MKLSLYTTCSLKKLFLLCCLTITANIVFAQASLSVQGVLTRSDGTAVDDGTYTVTFRLYDQPSGGNQVHSEPIDVETIGGVYSVVLGANASFPLTASFNTVYYLSVLAGSSELLPRPQLTHAPYALSLLGQNNKFPSTGTVTADAIIVPGGAPAGGVGGKGYSFGSGGDQDGGLFSLGDNNVALYANATKALEASNSGVSIPGTLNVTGTTVTNSQTVNGLQTINSNQIVNGFSTVTANQTVQGIVKSAQGIVNNAHTTTGIFFNNTNHDIQFNTNGNGRMLIGDNGTTYLWGNTEVNLQGGNLFLNGVKPKGTTGNARNLAIDLSSGRVFEESSSRRYKTNIRPLMEDFSLILKVQPRIYNRFEDAVDIDTSKFFELGYIAEEIDSIGLHKVVQYNNAGQIDGVDYTKMILYAVEVLKMQDTAIKQLQTQVDALKAENSGLTLQNNTLRTDNSDLKKQQAGINDQLTELFKRMQTLEASGAGK